MNFDELWNYVIDLSGASRQGIHGPGHWARVERNGLLIIAENGGDPDILRLFALFHDSRRINDHIDPGHGARGARFAESLRGELSSISDEGFDLLCEACEGHTDVIHHADPTIQACWDADRLDLPRVGISPDSKYLNTAFAMRLAASGDLGLLDQEPLRRP